MDDAEFMYKNGFYDGQCAMLAKMLLFVTKEMNVLDPKYKELEKERKRRLKNESE